MSPILAALPATGLKSTAPIHLRPLVRLHILPDSAQIPAEFHQMIEQTRSAAILEERQRITRDIHDTLAQGFMGVIVQLNAAEDAILGGYAKAAADHILRAASLARESLSETRRCVHGLRPAVLERMTFRAALQNVLEQATEGTALRTKLDIRGEETALPPLWEDYLLHIAQEALSNTIKHARATRFQVQLSFAGENLRLEIQDNGRGFCEGPRRGGIGLVGMRERVEQMTGTFAVTSSPNRGTKILVTMPAHRLAVLPQRSIPAKQFSPESGSDACGFPEAQNSLACAVS